MKNLLLAVAFAAVSSAAVAAPADVTVGMSEKEALDLAVPDWRGFIPRYKIACAESDDFHKVCTGNTADGVVILTFVRPAASMFSKYTVETIQVVKPSPPSAAVEAAARQKMDALCRSPERTAACE